MRVANRLSEVLDRFLRQKRMSLRDLADRSAIPQSTIVNMRHRLPTNAPTEQFKRLAKALDLNRQEERELLDAGLLAWSPAIVQELVDQLRDELASVRAATDRTRRPR